MTGASPSSGSTRHLVLAVIAVVAVIAVGTVGYIVIEGWPAFDSFYMTVTTVATVGFQEIHPLSTAGRAFTVVLIISGVGNPILFAGKPRAAAVRRGTESYFRTVSD